MRVLRNLHQELFEESWNFTISFQSQNAQNQIQLLSMHFSSLVNILDDFIDHQLFMFLAQIFDFFDRAVIFVSSSIFVLTCSVSLNWFDCSFNLKNCDSIDHLIEKTLERHFCKKLFANRFVQTFENIDDVTAQNLLRVCFVNYRSISRELHVLMNDHILFIKFC